MKFGRISKSQIIQLIGTTDNYALYEDTCEVSHIQVLTEQCKACDCYATSPFAGECEYYCSTCKNCPFYQSEKQYISKKVKIYKNEENYYGKKGTVGKSAIKVWIALHFCSPDDNGLVRSISISEICVLTGLHTRQIKYALKQLFKEGYIAYSASIPNCNSEFDVMLLEYRNMYATAEKGGKGYITLSENNLKEIMAFKNINELRTYVRLYLTCDDTAVRNNGKYQYFTSLSLFVAKKWLPEYLTFDNIKAIFASLKNHFIINEQNNMKYAVNFINSTNAKLLYNETLEDAETAVIDYINEINELVTTNINAESRIKMAQMGILTETPKKWKNKRILLTANSAQVLELAKLSIEYGLDAVKVAISKIVKNYHFEDKKIKSWGALARNYIKTFA